MTVVNFQNLSKTFLKAVILDYDNTLTIIEGIPDKSKGEYVYVDDLPDFPKFTDDSYFLQVGHKVYFREEGVNYNTEKESLLLNLWSLIELIEKYVYNRISTLSGVRNLWTDVNYKINTYRNPEANDAWGHIGELELIFKTGATKDDR